MPEELAQAFYLLAVGMIAVFTVLGLVVLLGNGLIWAINRYFPVRESVTPRPLSTEIHPASSAPTNPVVLAVIAAAVEEATDGRGYIQSIRSIN